MYLHIYVLVKYIYRQQIPPTRYNDPLFAKMNKFKIFFWVLTLTVNYTNALDLTTFYTYLTANESNNYECEIQKQLFLNDLDEKTEWALKSKFIIIL